MAAVDTAAALAAIPGRGAGTDAERRAAQWLAGELRSSGRQARTETFWCRPNGALTHAWHCLLAVAGSLLSVSHPVVGGVLVLLALLSLLADALTGRSPARRLTPEHASQNVISAGPPPAPRTAAQTAPDAAPPVRLLVTANYDAGRAGLAYRDALRRPAAALRRIAGDGALTPGWLGWTGIALIWLVAVAVLRDRGVHGTGIGVLQLVPTAALVVELALLLDLAGAAFGPAAGDNGTGVGVALALVRALDAAPPRHLRAELVLQGAGDGTMTGLRRHLRRRRRELRPQDTIVLGVGPCGTGRPCWWVSDGPLIPLRYPARMRAAARRAAASVTAGSAPGAVPHRGRGMSPALPARARGLPALSVGCIDRRGLAPRSHQRTDVADGLDPAAIDRLVQFALTLVDELDAEVGRTRHRPPAAAPADIHS